MVTINFAVLAAAATALLFSEFAAAKPEKIKKLRGKGKGKRKGPLTEPCVLYLIDVLMEDPAVDADFWECELAEADRKAFGHISVPIKGVSFEQLKSNEAVESGFSTLFAPGSFLDEDGFLNIPPGATVALERRGGGANVRRLNTGGVFGNRKVLMITAKSTTDTPSLSASLTPEQFSPEIFGAEGYSRVRNLKERIESCSFGQVTIEPYANVNIPTAGVVEVDLGRTTVGVNFQTVGDAMLLQAQVQYGENIINEVDHFMLCVPGAPIDFFAAAPINGKRSYYNDAKGWCTATLANVHEIGHNLGLQHSGGYLNGDKTANVSQYADRSGMMGSSGTFREPKACYNSAKSYQLGWYASSSISIDNIADLEQGREYVLHGIDDYDSNLSGQIVHIQIPGKVFAFDFVAGVPDFPATGTTADGNMYIGFHLAQGIIGGQQIYQNKVTITNVQGATPADDRSWLVDILSAGGQYVSPNFTGDGRDLTIEVVEINTSAVPAFARINISVPAEPTAAPSAAPSSAPSTAPSAAPSAAPSVAPSAAPFNAPSASPSAAPSAAPFNAPSVAPSAAPSAAPSNAPSIAPSAAPSTAPSSAPSAAPSKALSAAPSIGPSSAPSLAPSAAPTRAVIAPPTSAPSTGPSSAPSAAPSKALSAAPSISPSSAPSLAPSAAPTRAVIAPPTSAPSTGPSSAPSAAPSKALSAAPSIGPSSAPSLAPSAAPTRAVIAPPTSAPSTGPSSAPSAAPSKALSAAPSIGPSSAPSLAPSAAPTRAVIAPPTSAPTTGPSSAPSDAPTAAPSAAPSSAPSAAPSPAPSAVPSPAPSTAPSPLPSATPTSSPVAPTSSPVEPTSPPVEPPSVDCDGLRRNRCRRLPNDCEWVGSRRRGSCLALIPATTTPAPQASPQATPSPVAPTSGATSCADLNPLGRRECRNSILDCRWRRDSCVPR